MDNVTFNDVVSVLTNEVTTHALIAHADGSFTSMTKAEYERRQAEQSTPILPA
jgi:hypothetical protein